jgi:hypothetical protein
MSVIEDQRMSKRLGSDVIGLFRVDGLKYFLIDIISLNKIRFDI